MAATIGADLDGGFHCDMVRAGLALYGADASHAAPPGRPAGGGDGDAMQPIAGRVSMDSMTMDVTGSNESGPRGGDLVGTGEAVILPGARP